jgi:hypothetical protein
VLFSVLLCCFVYYYVVLFIIVLFCVLWCCSVYILLFCVLFLCKCVLYYIVLYCTVLYYCHRLATQLHLPNISIYTGTTKKYINISKNAFLKERRGPVICTKLPPSAFLPEGTVLNSAQMVPNRIRSWLALIFRLWYNEISRMCVCVCVCVCVWILRPKQDTGDKPLHREFP